jgi:cold shock CspA family protein
MGRSHETFGKKAVRERKEKKRKSKEKKRQERKENKSENGMDDMIAYVDEFGNITSTPPDETKKEEIKAEDIDVGVPKSSGDDEDPIHHGTVTFFNESKGFGFIRDLVTRQDVFVHVNGLIDPVTEGNRVSYEVVKGLKGPNAVNVKIDRE